MMQRRGISTPDPLYNSAEETTYESVAQGGVGTVLFPVPRDLNLGKPLIILCQDSGNNG